VALRMGGMVEVGAGGTHQARVEREAIQESMLARLEALDVGDQSLIFGRIDQTPDAGDGSYYIGRVAVWDEEREPVVVDWRAPVAEPFYRATGRVPMGLVRRRHFATRGRELLGIEDEYFGEAALGLADDETGAVAAAGGGPGSTQGTQTLIHTLETARTGRLGDAVATIQAEQDEVIRAPMQGVLIVQGGPGTGKTVVSLHRAAYLLYTHRFPLEGQGVLVVGPNRLFLTYIEQVLPSLGEAGVELAVLGGLLGKARVRDFVPDDVARVKGHVAMADVIDRAVRDRERPLREDLVIGYGLERMRLTVAESRRIVKQARRRFRTHNGARRFVVESVNEALAASARSEPDPDEVGERLEGRLEVREALEWMWPVLTAPHLLHDLYGSKALLRSAAGRFFEEHEYLALHRERSHADDIVWTNDDVPLLDEARYILGPRPGRKEADAVRTYGHIVVDEVQDLSPMQLRMLARRSLNGSMTLVGDIAQATSAWAHDDWDTILEYLPSRHEPRLRELTVGYRLPGPTMDLAARVLAEAAPQLTAPVPVRRRGDKPVFVETAPDGVLEAIVDAVRAERDEVGTGNVAVIALRDQVSAIGEALAEAGIPSGVAYHGALDMQVSVVPVRMVKGLEVDSAVVVEPARIVSEVAAGMRSLYVAITRATKRLTIVHSEPLPGALR
jgi:DNA helicase IV